jgi:hypothetical protein
VVPALRSGSCRLAWGTRLTRRSFDPRLAMHAGRHGAATAPAAAFRRAPRAGRGTAPAWGPCPDRSPRFRGPRYSEDAPRPFRRGPGALWRRSPPDRCCQGPPAGSPTRGITSAPARKNLAARPPVLPRTHAFARKNRGDREKLETAKLPQLVAWCALCLKRSCAGRACSLRAR